MTRSAPNLKAIVCFVAVMTALCAGAALLTVWQIGVDDDPFSCGYNATQEFSSENYVDDPKPGKVTRLRGDPLHNAAANPIADDDFYLARNYPAGFNNLTTNLPVAFSEPDSACERAFTSGDKANRVHFFLNTSQTNAQSRSRLTFELIWGGYWYNLLAQSSEGFAQHDMQVRFKGAGASVLLLAKTFNRDTRFSIDFPATNVLASAGPNTIELIRTGPNIANISYWVQFDFVKLEVDTNALADADGDGLPRWWEEDNHLSHTNAADAASDADGDGLTALQEDNGGVNSTDPNKADTDGDGLNDGAEFAAGSNPNLMDTDGDGQTDGEEANGMPPSNPLLVDSDGDGVKDWDEIVLGSDPYRANSVHAPQPFNNGSGIVTGTNFGDYAAFVEQMRGGPISPQPARKKPCNDEVYERK